MTKETYEAMIWSRMSEAAFQVHVVNDLKWAGFQIELIYHTHLSKRSQYGFQDLTAIRRSTDHVPHWIQYRKPRLLIVELKKQSGTMTREQVEWLHGWADLRDAGNPGIEVYLLRPSDQQAFQDVLIHGPVIGGGLRQWPHGCEEDIRKARPSRPGTPGVRPRKRSRRSIVRTGGD